LGYCVGDGEFYHVILGVADDEDVVVDSWWISCCDKVIKRFVLPALDRYDALVQKTRSSQSTPQTTQTDNQQERKRTHKNTSIQEHRIEIEE
jgi:hypothetical protein